MVPGALEADFTEDKLGGGGEGDAIVSGGVK